MKQLTIISGKGGTGKTTLVGALSSLAKDKVLADCDVDAADLFLILEPATIERGEFIGGRKPVVDEEKCTQCGVCTELCRFDAIKDGRVDILECEGCGLCALGCPEEAITMKDSPSGKWYISETRNGPMTHARLGIGEENSGKLVAEVRKLAQFLAEQRNLELIIIDGPPGIGCPVISSLTGADLALIVTEPTVAGIHDLERLIKLAEHFDIPTLICINKYDLNPAKTLQIEQYCQRKGLRLIGKIPFDVAVVKAMVERKTVMEYPCAAVQDAIKSMWQEVQEALANKRTPT
ncbi:MAG: (4Fe-4S)-binding protein [Deltaproteobacteria bacterium]|mgnify:CR=1 FL=1|nr:MAG: (4Fe-4S)-binding protein [Deltaproteobacteria bacterium]